MIYLIRHGETLWNAARRFQGQLDSPLTRKGIAQVSGNGETLRREIAEPASYTVVSSPLGRAWQSAAIVAGTLGLDSEGIVFEDRLKEKSFGRLQGLTRPEVETAFPGLWTERAADPWNWCYPGGESYALLDARVGAWLDEQSAEARLIVICHGVVARVLRGRYAGMTREATMNLGEEQDCVWRLERGRIETLVAA